jgi:putative NADPH-quinone reductase
VNISIILAHPNPQSFNHAIAEAAADELRQRGHEVHFHDLYTEKFDPLFRKGEELPGATLHPVIVAQGKEIVSADGIVIVHPNWWGQPPAILTGWIDRVLRAGQAYRFVTNDSGEGVPVGLMKAKAAVVFNTANTPKAREDSVFGDPLETIWKNCVFGLCGVTNYHREIFRVVVTSTPAQRDEWLQTVRTTMTRLFP